MALTALLDRIAHDPDCAVLPAAGQPNIDSAHVVPEDVRAFYDVCGGVTIGRGSEYEVRLVGPDECVLANNVILGDTLLRDLANRVPEELQRDASWDWYLIADLWNGDYLVIDAGQARNGACYDAHWETYMDTYHDRMPAIASALTSLLERLYANKGRYWYWLEPGFES